jgi:hypothetical protein
MILPFDALHEYEWFFRLLGETALALLAVVNDHLHRARLKRLKEELEERSHEAECYLQEFEKLDTPPPKIPQRKRKH